MIPLKLAALIVAKELDAISCDLKAMGDKRMTDETTVALWHERAVCALKSITARAENFEACQKRAELSQDAPESTEAWLRS